MREFSVCHIKYAEEYKYNYIILVKNADDPMLTPLKFKEYYDVDFYNSDLYNQFKEQHDFLCSQCSSVAISFTSDKTAQSFIENVLIPYEIAFHLNK